VPSRPALAALSALALTGCLPAGNPASGPSASASEANVAVGDSNAPMPPTNPGHIRREDGQELPDTRCAPGAINPNVIQANIASTICQSGWTKMVRPTTSVTNRMKKEFGQSYGRSAGTAGEHDHLLSGVASITAGVSPVQGVSGRALTMAK
jgi:hypothetical protein